jgi:hypothetical protein
MDMEFHNGMSSSGKLYGFLPDLATLDEDCEVADELDAARFVESFTKFADELETARFVESFARVAEELLTAGVICCTLDDDIITHIETSEELDSGIYRSIW